MRLVIVEDENTVAQRLERLARDILSDKLTSLRVFHALDDADDFIATEVVDLMFLDLNLAGRDGFELLKTVVARSFHTIVVSAYADRAIEAFEFGVLDFVSKPFTRARLKKALERYESPFRQQRTRYIAIKRRGVIEPVDLDRVHFFRGANVYSEACLEDGSVLLHDKPLSRLEQVLPAHFERVHKSYIVNLSRVATIRQSGNSAELAMQSGECVPVSRSRIAEIKNRLI